TLTWIKFAMVGVLLLLVTLAVLIYLKYLCNRREESDQPMELDRPVTAVACNFRDAMQPVREGDVIPPVELAPFNPAEAEQAIGLQTGAAHDHTSDTERPSTLTWIKFAMVGVLLLLVTLAVLIYLKYLCNRREEVISNIERESEVEDTSSFISKNAKPISNVEDTQEDSEVTETPNRSRSATSSAYFQKSNTASGQVRKEENAHLISQTEMEKRSPESSRT
ncbi:hypothetical protein GCK32_018505, partial [Trichostrongylus colubriformis]